MLITILLLLKEIKRGNRILRLVFVLLKVQFIIIFIT